MALALPGTDVTERFSFPQPAAIPLSLHVRGTLIIATRAQLFLLGKQDTYERALKSDTAEALRGVVANSWVPASLAHEHYVAIDGLQISDGDLALSHRGVSDRVHGVFLSTAVRGLRAVGVLTPWTALALAPKVYGRVFDGGLVGVERASPSEAKLHLAGNPLLGHRFHRIGVRTHVQSAMSVCAKGVQVREETCDPGLGYVRYSVRWDVR